MGGIAEWLARAAVEAASDVAALMAEELGVDDEWRDAQLSAFKEIARGYVPGDITRGQRVAIADHCEGCSSVGEKGRMVSAMFQRAL